MKKMLVIGSLVVGLASLVLPFSGAHAQQKKDYGLSLTVQEVNRGNANLLPSKIAGAGTVPELVGTLVGAVLGFLGIVFFGLIFYAGILWMTARGSEDSISKAKSIMEASVIGLVIVLAAYAITQFVFDQLSRNAAASSAAGNNVSCVINVTRDSCLAENTNANASICAWINEGTDNARCVDVGN